MVKKISDNIGFDGSYFFCLRCGKAGYSSVAQVRGHLSVCPGTAIRKGLLPATCNPLASVQRAGLATQVPASGLNPLGNAQEASLQNFQVPAPAPALGYLPGADYQQAAILQELGTHRQEISQLQNEYSHMLVQKNAPLSGGDWFSQNKGLIIILGLLLLVVLLKQQPCRLGGGEKASSLPTFGEKALSQLTSRAISKGVDSFFK